MALLAIPILIHLFKPRKVRQTPFSSLRWLRASQHRLSRRIRWHQILLLALRLAFVTFLVLSLAKPMLSLHAGGHERDRFLVVDVSRSMGYTPDTGPVPIDTAKDICLQLSAEVTAGDRTAIILAGPSARPLGPMVSDPSAYHSQIQSITPTAGAANFSRVLDLVPPMVGTPREDAVLDLFFLTDNHLQNWSQAAIRQFMDQSPEPVEVHVVDVGPADVANAWISDVRFRESRSQAGHSIRVQVGGEGHEVLHRTVILDGLSGLPKQARAVDVRPGALSRVTFEIPSGYDLSGRIARVHLEPEDSLPMDDVSWLNLDATLGTTILVVEPQTTHVEELRPGFYVRTALAALSDAQNGTLDVLHRTDTDVLAPAIERADTVILVDVPSLSDGDLAALSARVRDGMGLVVFLGPSALREFYNTKLHNPLRPSVSLLPAPLGEVVTADDQAELPRISEIQWSHPIFRRLFDPVYGDLAQVRFRSFYEWSVPANGENVHVLAAIAGHGAAIVEHSFGRGKVIVFNTTGNDQWSDLPRRKSFVPLLDQLLDYLVGGRKRATFTVGDTIRLPIPLNAAGVEVTVKTPSGQVLHPTPRRLGAAMAVDVEGVSKPGVYRVSYADQGKGGAFPFVLQPSPQDRSLVRANTELLKSWWAPATVVIDRPDANTGKLQLTRTRFFLDPWFAALACLALLAEMFFVHWLCPRVNPGVVSTPIVARHGFFGKRNDTEMQR